MSFKSGSTTSQKREADDDIIEYTPSKKRKRMTKTAFVQIVPAQNQSISSGPIEVGLSKKCTTVAEHASFLLDRINHSQGSVLGLQLAGPVCLAAIFLDKVALMEHDDELDLDVKYTFQFKTCVRANANVPVEGGEKPEEALEEGELEELKVEQDQEGSGLNDVEQQQQQVQQEQQEYLDIVDNRQWQVVRHGRMNCQNCGEEGHMAMDCPHIGGAGHRMTLFRQPTCLCCWRTDHHTRRCPHAHPKALVAVRQGYQNRLNICFYCGQQGHSLRVCIKRRLGQGEQLRAGFELHTSHAQAGHSREDVRYGQDNRTRANFGEGTSQGNRMAENWPNGEFDEFDYFRLP